MLTRLDPFSLLERSDKWYLGGGQAALYAPAFPKYLDTPGFWDEAYFADIRLERLFCILPLDDKGHPITLRRVVRRWTPDRLTQIYTVEGAPGIQIQEERVVTPHDTLACRLTLSTTNKDPARLHLLLWSLQEMRPLQDAPAEQTVTTAAEVERDPDAICFAHRIRYGNAADTPAEVHGWGTRAQTEPSSPTPAVYVALGGDRLPDSGTINLAESTDTAPLWQLSVFPEKFRNGMLSQENQAEAGWNPNGLLHLALHYTAEAMPGSPDVLTFGAALALTRAEALANLRADMTVDVTALSRRNWTDYFASVPYFTCSDPYLQTAYWYRWYGLRLLTVDVNQTRLPHPCVFEGIGAFRSHISYSAPCHVRETAWMRNPALAMGSLENFLANQIHEEDGENDGFLPGHLYLWRQDRGFYHADWGAAALRIYHHTHSLDFVRRVYPGLVSYAEYFDRERDQEQVLLYDVLDQGETGQEYMSRYLFVEPTADAWGPLQIKGVDATCYQYSLQRALAFFARLLDQPEDADWWTEKADATREAIRELMWDAEAGLFKDVHPETLECSPCKAAVGFYPFLTDIALPAHLPAFLAHLQNPRTFGTPFPLPASSVDDPYFDAEAEWKSKRTNCPWNGRVWPMTSSHIADALAHATRTLSPEAAPYAVDFIRRYIHMLFHDRDPKRPNAYEHYNPYTGTPSLYRGVDDYQHSWIVDLILRHVVGIQPEPGPTGALILDPLPFGLERFRVEGVPIRGHTLDVSWSRQEGFLIRVDGRERLHLPEPQYVEVAL